ncbi:hypothetical protein DEO72_LG6g1159 [Vigna unguiculata]|uniref:Uncharacterized protein n=1 Tax=Vigna unguiculata TaxID=3917 RepID=A0A4D6M8K7_VIGUN|nr:hypothetical protein DEO72_LG6g1159 [Vigna unguiculata]
MRTAPLPLAVQAVVATVVRSTTAYPCPRNPSSGHAASLVWNSTSTARPRCWSSVRQRRGHYRFAGPRAAALPPPQHRVVEGSPTSFVKNAAAATATCCCHPLYAVGAPSASAALVAGPRAALVAGLRAATLLPPRPLPLQLLLVAATLYWMFKAV